MMKRGYLVVDIETVPDGALYQPPEVKLGEERPFPPLFAHRPIVIGALLLDDNYRFQKLNVFRGESEAELLRGFATYVDEKRPNLITYNGRSFDLPVIALRCLRHGIPLRFYYDDRDYRHRYSEAGHFDLCDFLAEHGATRPMGLDAMARLIGLPGKIGVDGSQVEGLYNAGQLEAIRDYCLADVAQTAFLLLRVRLLQGLLSVDNYRQMATDLLAACAGDGRLKLLVERADRQRLLLAPAPPTP